MPGIPLRRHLLEACRDRIEADRLYTVRELAKLAGLAQNTLWTMARCGALPGALSYPNMPGASSNGPQYIWDGRQLLRLIDQPQQILLDHDAHPAHSLHRAGCRCDSCVTTLRRANQRAPRQESEEVFPRASRERLLVLVADGTPVKDAAAEVGVNSRWVYGRAQWDPDFAARLDEAGWVLCVFGVTDPRCSSQAGYRGHRGVRESRPPCRGTGCRKWLRDHTRSESEQTPPDEDRPSDLPHVLYPTV
ncbi:hypothetical protein K388_06708 [Streptomyces sp. KhCrAH-43]|uniref:hypothetical protein n=1 Tax=unclassified Streptomyces TaxID=2593676 RepID=UPI000369618C|nr:MULTISPECIES: hypothetical protein [unclassified Streptomyces]MYS33402.1 hypothetical protein [Streptomyces sp. SID4920]MYX64040.1 hypothetical protein [Streptomyces sp. SID8373]RAJ49790.1 hypothetical protein K388_06708 [Streptomyces sp. KhCrAH-43]